MLRGKAALKNGLFFHPRLPEFQGTKIPFKTKTTKKGQKRIAAPARGHYSCFQQHFCGIISPGQRVKRRPIPGPSPGPAKSASARSPLKTPAGFCATLTGALETPRRLRARDSAAPCREPAASRRAKRELSEDLLSDGRGTCPRLGPHPRLPAPPERSSGKVGGSSFQVRGAWRPASSQPPASSRAPPPLSLPGSGRAVGEGKGHMGPRDM